MNKLLYFLFFLINPTLSSNATHNSGKDSVIHIIREFDTDYKNGIMPETQYLDTVLHTMQMVLSQDIFFNHDELSRLLSTYRKTIWNKPNDIENKINYYAVLSNQAGMAGRDGEMLYYTEKIEELEKKNTDRPSITALTIISNYYNTKSSFKHTQQLFKDKRDFIQSIPTLAYNGQLDMRQLVQANKMLLEFSDALFMLGDTVSGNEAISIMYRINEIIQSRSDNDNEISHSRYSIALASWTKGEVLGDMLTMQYSLNELNQLLLDKNTPDHLKNYIEFTMVDKKVGIFLDNYQNDSALYYINRLENLYNKKEWDYNAYMITKYKARALYQQGFYKESVDTLVNALIILEKYKSNIVQNISNMMYAQAKAEDQQLLLSESEKSIKTSKQWLFVSFIATFLFILSAISLIIFFRQKQRSKFLEFKLNMARNIHDETSPALLYAKALAKANRGKESNVKSELEQHIDHTMQVIRSLSHDLKSDKNSMVKDLVEQSTELLNKLSFENNVYQFRITKNIENNRFISHFQFTQLKAVINECITNTIKHATFKNIYLDFETLDGRLIIKYKDDGTGWDERADIRGIGIQNMKERIEKLNGEFRLLNEHPKGYRIYIYIPLR